MKKKILLLGHTGKMGTAISRVFAQDYELIGRNSRDMNAACFEEVAALIEACRPDIVVNTVALAGIDVCEKESGSAMQLNTLLPRFLARCAVEKRFHLVHFSTDAVFPDRTTGFYTESSVPCPVNIYGLTKYGGDCFVQESGCRYYLARISVLFGPTSKGGQFVEKMLARIEAGQKEISVADDIIATPTYNLDVARKIKEMLESDQESGLYHVVNEGRASLWELMQEVVTQLNLKVTVHKASYKDFPAAARKNICTPLRSEKIGNLRPWKDAVKEYCQAKGACAHG